MKDVVREFTEIEMVKEMKRFERKEAWGRWKAAKGFVESCGYSNLMCHHGISTVVGSNSCEIRRDAINVSLSLSHVFLSLSPTFSLSLSEHLTFHRDMISLVDH